MLTTLLRCQILVLLFSLSSLSFIMAQHTGSTKDDLTEAKLSGQLPHLNQAEEHPSFKAMACPSAFNMATPYSSNNGHRGCMFDIYATNTVEITCFDVNLYAGTTANYEIYYRPGTHVGFENNSAAWTFLGGATGVTSAGNNLPTALPINFSVSIPAGSRYSFYITNDSGGGTRYTDGTAVGNFLAADPNITVYEGVGKSYPFGLTFTVRNFNGHIFYNLGSVLNVGEPVLEADGKDDHIQLSWSGATTSDIRSYAIERSENGTDFETIANFQPSSNPNSFNDSDTRPRTTYHYRLRTTDENGNVATSEVVTASLRDYRQFEVGQLHPNPFTSAPTLNVNLREGGKITLEVVDLMGKVHHREAHSLASGPHRLELSFTLLPPGFYLLRLQVGGQQETVRFQKL